ncbi:MAG: gliding motility-associated C-terminal domain-containing protein [Flavobacteriales bacterium]|nr:gliding motility-associated C-terminal domain-containing protein [Flavobacteriales bacterium]
MTQLNANRLRNAMILCCLAAILNVFSISAQTSFQKVFRWTGNTYVSEVRSQSTGDMLFAGTMDAQVFLASMDCQGLVNWSVASTSGSVNMNLPIKSISDQTGNIYFIYNTGELADNSTDAHVVKMGPDQVVIWHKSISGIYNDYVADIIIGADGNIVVCGTTSSFGADAPSGIYCDVFTFCLNASGNVIWSRTYGNSSVDDSAASIGQSYDGSFIIIGNSGPVDISRVFLLKTDNVGLASWCMKYGNPNHRNRSTDLLLLNDTTAIVSGASTELGTSFLDPAQACVWNVNLNNGDLTNAVAYPDVDNLTSEILELTMTSQGILMSAMYEGYSTYNSSSDLGKAVLMRMGNDTSLNFSMLITTGGTEGCQVQNAADGTAIFVSNTSQFSDPCCINEPVISKLNGSLQSGCNQINVFTETMPTPLGAIVPNSFVLLQDTVLDISNLGFSQSEIPIPEIEVLCENPELLLSTFSGNGGCVSDYLAFEDESEGNILTWNWDFGDGNFSDFQNPANSYLSEGTYTVSLTVSDGCSEHTSAINIQVDPTPVTDAGFDQYIRIGDSVVIGIMPFDEDLEYLWAPPGSLIDPDMPQTEASPVITTSFMLTVSNDLGCSTTDNVTVFVDTSPIIPDQDGELFVPNVFSPNEDGQNDVLYVYGGPFTNFNLEVFNRLGERAFATTNQEVGWDGMFRGRHAPIGAYYYNLTVTDETGADVETAGNITLTR